MSMKELAIALLDGAFEDPLWSTFLEQLRIAARAEFVTFVFQPPGCAFDESLHLIAGDVTVAASKAIYRKYFHPGDPMSRIETRENLPYSLNRILEMDRGEHREFYHNLTENLGITAIRKMRIKEASGVDGWLTIARGAPDFTEEADALLVELAPLVRAALRTFVARERDRLTVSLASETVGRLEFGWIALDRDGTVLECDSFAETVLSQSQVLFRNGNGRLSASSPALDREVAKAVASLSAQPPGRPRALPLRADPWLDMLLVQANRKGFVTNAIPSVIAYVHGDNWRTHERCTQLMDLFLLTKSEARLTLALCRGKSIGEAAQEIGLTVETARSYSKAIYGKTGARGLPDLVRIIMGSVLALAQAD